MNQENLQAFLQKLRRDAVIQPDFKAQGVKVALLIWLRSLVFLLMKTPLPNS